MAHSTHRNDFLKQLEAWSLCKVFAETMIVCLSMALTILLRDFQTGLKKYSETSK